MRSIRHDDGNRRITAKINVPMGAYDIALYAMANPVFNNHPSPNNLFDNQTKRELFNLAKDTVRLFGVSHDIACDRAMKNFKNRLNRNIERVRELFPEVD